MWEEISAQDRDVEALSNLTWVRKGDIDSKLVQLEYAEILAGIEEDKVATAGVKWSQDIFRRGNQRGSSLHPSSISGLVETPVEQLIVKNGMVFIVVIKKQ